MLDAMGLKTGIDLDKLLQVRDIVLGSLPDEPMYGFTPDAGLPKGYGANGKAGWGILQDRFPGDQPGTHGGQEAIGSQVGKIFNRPRGSVNHAVRIDFPVDTIKEGLACSDRFRHLRCLMRRQAGAPIGQ